MGLCATGALVGGPVGAGVAVVGVGVGLVGYATGAAVQTVGSAVGWGLDKTGEVSGAAFELTDAAIVQVSFREPTRSSAR